MNMQSRIGYQETINCTKLCTIRIAFVKGWGEKYKRQVKYIYYKQLIFKKNQSTARIRVPSEWNLSL